MPEPQHLQFVQSLEPLQGGGLGTAVRQLHDAMRKSGLASAILTTRRRDFCEEWPGVVQCVRNGPDKAFYASGLRAAAEGAITPDTVVHGHGLYVYPNWLIGGICRRRRLPLVYHPHGFFEPWILQRSRGRKRVAHWLFEDANFRHVRLWRALTSKEADQVKVVVGAGANVVVAPNGMDLAPVKMADFAQKSGRRRALFLGRLHPKKGLALLIQAWAGLREEARDWELVVAGPDEGGHEAEVRKWVSQAGLGEVVSFVGSVSGPAKYELIASADLFVLTSYSEGLPMAPLESMAAGVPVLLTDACNLPAVAPAGAGWVGPVTPESVAMQLRVALLASDEERRQRGQAGRRLIERNFSWENTVATLRAACQDIA